MRLREDTEWDDAQADKLAGRDQVLDDSPTAEASELVVGDILEAEDVRWWSHTPNRGVYTGAAIETTGDGKLRISFISDNDRNRTLTVPDNRRFLKAAGA